MELVAVLILLFAVLAGNWSSHYPLSGWYWLACTVLWLVTACPFFVKMANSSPLGDWGLQIVLPAAVLGGVWIGWGCAWLRRRHRIPAPR